MKDHQRLPFLLRYEEEPEGEPGGNHPRERQPAEIAEGGDGAEVQRTRGHFRELKVGPGMQVGFTHGLDKFLGPGARAQELVLPFAGHVGEQEGEASAG